MTQTDNGGTAFISASDDALEIIGQDSTMAMLINDFGRFSWELSPPFSALRQAVIGQMLSSQAAKSINTRFTTSYKSNWQIANSTVADLRLVGLSTTKAETIIHLAQLQVEGKLDAICELEDACMKQQLLEIKGIGPWTVDMLLIFSLGRLNIWPLTDGGVQNAARELYLAEDKHLLTILGKRFAPFESAAAWYLWQWLDAKRPQLNRVLNKSPVPQTSQ